MCANAETYLEWSGRGCRPLHGLERRTSLSKHVNPSTSSDHYCGDTDHRGRAANQQTDFHRALRRGGSTSSRRTGWLGSLLAQPRCTPGISGSDPRAGIDLSQLRSEDIWVSSDGRRVQITLPPPQVFTEQVSLDLANSRVIENTDFCPGFICPRTNLESFSQAVDAEAKAALVQAAIEAGILSQAARDAEAYYTQLLNSLGIAEVRVIVRGYGGG